MFSQDCRATVVRHSHDIGMSVAKISHCKFAKISRRHVRDTRTYVARPLHDSRATVLRNIFGEKIRINFLNMFKTFATSSRHMKPHVVRKSATKFAKQSRKIRMSVRY